MQGAYNSNMKKICLPRSHSQIHKKCRLRNESTLQVLYIWRTNQPHEKPQKIPAIVGPKAEPIEIQSTCLYMMLLKLNLIDVVANFINSTNNTFGISGGVRIPNDCISQAYFYWLIHLLGFILSKEVEDKSN